MTVETLRLDESLVFKICKTFSFQTLLYVSTKLINGLCVLGELKISGNGQTTVRTYLFIYLFVCLFIYLFICLFIYLFVCLFVYLVVSQDTSY